MNNTNANRIPMLDLSKLNLNREHYDYDVTPKVLVGQPLPQPKLEAQITEETTEPTPQTKIKASVTKSTVCAIQ